MREQEQKKNNVSRGRRMKHKQQAINESNKQGKEKINKNNDLEKQQTKDKDRKFCVRAFLLFLPSS